MTPVVFWGVACEYHYSSFGVRCLGQQFGLACCFLWPAVSSFVVWLDRAAQCTVQPPWAGVGVCSGFLTAALGGARTAKHSVLNCTCELPVQTLGSPPHAFLELLLVVKRFDQRIRIETPSLSGSARLKGWLRGPCWASALTWYLSAVLS